MLDASRLMENLVSYPPKIAKTDDEIVACFGILHSLRPHLVEAEFLEMIKRMQAEGYQLLYLKNEQGEVVAVAGFRISHNLFMGKNLYVDDLITKTNERSKGYGETLMCWLRKLGEEQECTTMHLDSGTHRGEAHKFYFRQGLTIASYHFSEALTCTKS